MTLLAVDKLHRADAGRDVEILMNGRDEGAGTERAELGRKSHRRVALDDHESLAQGAGRIVFHRFVLRGARGRVPRLSPRGSKNRGTSNGTSRERRF
jgi:hypothetical protein